MVTTVDVPRRVLLLTTATTYRTQAFVDAAARLDVEVLTATDMAQELASFWNEELGLDFGDRTAASAAITAFARRNPLAAILAVDDSGSLLAAQASAELGLPHNSPDAAEAARNKYRMRTLLHRAGVASPQFRLCSTADDPSALAEVVRYPCVVKPLELSGSRGVMRANDATECVVAIRRLTALLRTLHPGALKHTFLIEDFMPGVEVALEGLLDNGQLHVLTLFDKPDPLDGPFFEETLYVTPSRLPRAAQAAIADCAAQAAAALGLSRGPLHAELRLNEEGPWIVELAGRSIGGLCSKTLRFGQGTSLEELILRQACSLPLPVLEREAEARGVMMIPIPKAGMLACVEGLAEAEAVPGIEEVDITARLYYPLVPLPEGDSYLGFIFARGVTADGVEQSLRMAHSKLRFELKPSFALMQ